MRTGSGRATELSLALTAPWGPYWQATALEGPEPATVTRPLELLLESLLALHATRHRLHDLQIAVSEHGQYAITEQARSTPRPRRSTSAPTCGPIGPTGSG
jgi:hypothetical protein